MEIDFSRSVRGLWIADEPHSYLAAWFPRLRSKHGVFIPLTGGLNVLFGRNGTGKTHALEAIRSAATFSISAFEGFVLNRPMEAQSPSVATELLPLDARGYRSRWAAPQEDMDVAGSGFTSYISRDRIAEVEVLLGEFAAAGHCILTRGVPEQMAERYQLLYSDGGMNSPSAVKIVPILLPGDDGLHCRQHAEEIVRSFASVSIAMKAFYEAVAGEDRNDYSDIEEMCDALFDRWADQWSWSPLFNRRNFGSLNISMWEEHADRFVQRLTSSDTPVLYLPSVYEFRDYDKDSEFPSFDGFGGFECISEGEDYRSADSHIGTLRREQVLGAGPGTMSGLPEDRRLTMGADTLTSDLRSRLGFLPSLSQLGYTIYETSTPGSNIVGHLTLPSGADASYGSLAERRWLSLGLRTRSLGRRKYSPQLLLIDEPEAGLHRTAEMALAGSLSSPVWCREAVIVVATHAPAFLNRPGANVLQIEGSDIHSLTIPQRRDLDFLGLRPGDLLGTTKVFLLVEGEHDRIVLEVLLGDELRDAQCAILVARGGKNMRDIFDSQVLFEHTSATLMALLDNTVATRVTTVWAAARDLAGKGLMDEAVAGILAALPKGESPESLFLAEFLPQVLQPRILLGG